MKLIRSMATVGGLTIGSRAAGYIREVLMASFLGAGFISDAFVVALKIPSVFRRILAEGAFNAAFVPMFAGLLASEGEKEAKTYAEEIFAVLTAILVVLVIFAEFFMPWLMRVFVPGFGATPERLELAIQFTRITFPFILFISLTALFSGVLNSFEKFAAVASSPMMGNLGITATVYVLYLLTDIPAGHAFSVGVFICGVIQLIWVVVPAYRQGTGLRLLFPRWTKRVKKFFLLVGPAAAGSGVVQVSIFIDILIASLLPAGGMSYIHYADRLNQLPLSILGTAVGTALLPLLSKQIRSNDINAARESQNLALEYSLLLTIPATIGLIFLAHPLIKVLFEHGRFGPAETLATSHALMALAAGLPAYVLIKIFSTSFFARENTKTPVLIAIFAVAINIGLSLLLIRSLQHVGIALSTAISAWINVSLLAYKLWREGFLILNLRFKKFLPRLAIASTLTAGVIQFIHPIAIPLTTGILVQQILALILLVGGGMIAFVILARLTGALDFKDLRFQLKAAA